MIKKIEDLNIINNLLSNFNVSVNEIGVYTNYYAYYEDNDILGFISFDIIYDRAEINYIYTVENARRKNVASKLFDNMVEKCTKLHCENITLEVRETNIPAISFYEKKGFKKTAIRKNYYKNENGILMMKEMI